MKKALALLLGLAMLLPISGCRSKNDGTRYQQYASMTPEEIVKKMTLEEKAAQMVQPILYASEVDGMKTNCYGSIYGDEGMLTAEQWRATVDEYQKAAIESESGIPFLLAQDDVHGVGYCVGAVYFPHNIGQGAANDEELAYQVGLITADEAKMCHMLWNLYPCVAQSTDPRWGRTYECYSSDLETITKLSTAYTKGLIDGGVIACSKHFFGDGNTTFGTGECSDYERLIDRGNAELSEAEINELLKVYQAQIDAGVQTIMVSYSSLNGIKMHEQGDYIWKLKNEMGFEGFVISDSMAIKDTSPETYEEQVISAINCGIDVLMEGERYEEARQIIVDAVKSKKITKDRVDDAVRRIIKVKKDAGIFDDPFCENLTTVQQQPGSMDYRAVAEKLVEKSLVLLKNENDTLPFKAGTKIYITGPAADNCRAQVGGWTMGWDQARVQEIEGVTTIKEAFERYAEDYGIEVITDKERASEADVTLLCVGENSYAEWLGDTNSLKLTGITGLSANKSAIDEARELGKPTVTCIIAGRHVLIEEEDYNNWDSVVMCYLPGSEGKGISDVLCGCSDFTGKLPSPWYSSVDQIGTDECWFERGYGLSYSESFVPNSDVAAKADTSSSGFSFNTAASGTNYSRGVFENSQYTNEYANLSMNIQEGFTQVDDTKLRQQAEFFASDYNVEEEKTYYDTLIWDNAFESGSAVVIVEFVNASQGVPDNPDCTAEELIDYYNSFSPKEDNGSISHTHPVEKQKVTLGGNEYIKDVIKDDYQGQIYETTHYARRIDDDLILVIEVQLWDKNFSESTDFVESWFA